MTVYGMRQQAAVFRAWAVWCGEHGFESEAAGYVQAAMELERRVSIAEERAEG